MTHPQHPSHEGNVTQRVRRRPRHPTQLRLAFSFTPTMSARYSPNVKSPLKDPATHKRQAQFSSSLPSLKSRFVTTFSPRFTQCAVPSNSTPSKRILLPWEGMELPHYHCWNTLVASSSPIASSSSLQSAIQSSSQEIGDDSGGRFALSSRENMRARQKHTRRRGRDDGDETIPMSVGKNRVSRESRQQHEYPSATSLRRVGRATPRSYSAMYRADFNKEYRNEGKLLKNVMLTRTGNRVRKSFVDQVKNGNTHISVEQFEDALASLSRERRIKTALEALAMAEEGPLSEAIAQEKSLRLYTIMLDIYGKGFQLSRAFSLFYGMSRNGVRPNVITYNAMIAACARSNEPDLAYELFEEMCANGLKADKFTYGSLINSCAKCGQVERAFEISQMMDEKGVEKDQTVYSALMDACGRTEQLERALMVFEDMKRKGVWPNLVTFSVLMDICANAREPTRAFQLFSELKHWGFRTANVVIFTALIDACGKSGLPERAELVLRTMVAQGIKPNEITFGALMEGWAKDGRLDKAFEVLERMVKDFNVLPNAVLVGGLVDACRRKWETWRVGRLWEIVVEYNVRPARAFYPPLIAMAVIERDVRLATEVLLHAYARGFLRRAALKSSDRALHATAYAVTFYWREFVRGGLVQASAMERVGTALKSMGMTEREMEKVSVVEARRFCMAWGEVETKEGGGVQVRHGTRRDRRGVYRKDERVSQAARRAKEDAAAGIGKGA